MVWNQKNAQNWADENNTDWVLPLIVAWFIVELNNWYSSNSIDWFGLRQAATWGDSIITWGDMQRKWGDIDMPGWSGAVNPSWSLELLSVFFSDDNAPWYGKNESQWYD